MDAGDNKGNYSPWNESSVYIKKIPGSFCSDAVFYTRHFPRTRVCKQTRAYVNVRSVIMHVVNKRKEVWQTTAAEDHDRKKGAARMMFSDGVCKAKTNLSKVILY